MLTAPLPHAVLPPVYQHHHSPPSETRHAVSCMLHSSGDRSWTCASALARPRPLLHTPAAAAVCGAHSPQEAVAGQGLGLAPGSHLGAAADVVGNVHGEERVA